MDILELPSIPRKREDLKVLIATARRDRRRARMMRYASYGIIALGVMILTLGSCTHPAAMSYVSYLSIVTR